MNPVNGKWHLPDSVKGRKLVQQYLLQIRDKGVLDISEKKGRELNQKGGSSSQRLARAGAHDEPPQHVPNNNNNTFSGWLQDGRKYAINKQYYSEKKFDDLMTDAIRRTGDPGFNIRDMSPSI